MKLTSHAMRRAAAAAITCAAFALPAAALTSAGRGRRCRLPGSGARLAPKATAYVANGGGTVTPINTATNKAGKAITAGADPFAIAITPDGKTAYVTNYDWGAVTPISTATNTAGASIVVGTVPAPSPSPRTTRRRTSQTSISGTVTPIAIATNTPGPPITVGIGPSAIAITPDGEDRLRRQQIRGRPGHSDADRDRHQHAGAHRSRSAASPTALPSPRTARPPTSPTTTQAP